MIDDMGFVMRAIRKKNCARELDDEVVLLILIAYNQSESASRRTSRQQRELMRIRYGMSPR